MTFDIYKTNDSSFWFCECGSFIGECDNFYKLDWIVKLKLIFVCIVAWVDFEWTEWIEIMSNEDAVRITLIIDIILTALFVLLDMIILYSPTETESYKSKESVNKTAEEIKEMRDLVVAQNKWAE